MVRQIKNAALLVVALCCGVLPAQASIVSFDFNALSDGASNTSVQTYMRNILLGAGAGSVNVSGSVGEKNYLADNHIVGPTYINVLGQTRVRSLTLGNTDNNVYHAGDLDTYLINTGADRITMTFTNPIYVVSFDYEIFPNGDCPTGTCSAANWPDFTFEANDGVVFHTLGVMPGQQGTFPHSPFSGPIGNELAPQFLGTSGLWFFPAGVTKLEFIDWPVHIGIDNLQIGNNLCDIPGKCDGPVVPEPSSLLLMGPGLLALWRRSRTGGKRRV